MFFHCVCRHFLSEIRSTKSNDEIKTHYRCLFFKEKNLSDEKIFTDTEKTLTEQKIWSVLIPFFMNVLLSSRNWYVTFILSLKYNFFV